MRSALIRRSVIALGLLLGAVPAWADTRENDTFTEASNTNLSSHTSDSGSAWTESGTAGDQRVNASDYAEAVNGAVRRARMSDDLGTPDAVVTADCKIVAGAVGVCGVSMRVSSDFANGYFCYLEWDGTNVDRVLVSRVATVNNETDYGQTNLSTNTFYEVRLKVVGSTIQCCANNSCSAEYAETSISTGNNAGIMTQGATNQQLDNFRVSPARRSH